VSHNLATSAVDSTGVAWFDATRIWLARFPLSIIQLAGRIGVGATFFKAGLLKYQSWEFTVRLFQVEYHVPLLDPAVAARVAMVQELTIAILLFLGLATRIATLPLLGMIVVIQVFVYPNAYNEHLVWGAILVLLLTRGPGVFSVDCLIGSRLFAADILRGLRKIDLEGIDLTAANRMTRRALVAVGENRLGRMTVACPIGPTGEPRDASAHPRCAA